MKNILIILFFGVQAAHSQAIWVVWNDSLFIKRGADSVYYDEYMFFDNIIKLKASKQNTLVSGTNIKTINSTSILGSGDIVIGGSASFSSITGAYTDNSSLVTGFGLKQNTITTGTASQYFKGDLSLATFPTTTAAFTSSTNKNFVTDAQATVIGNTSGTNSGDNSANSLYSSLVSNANHSGDATGSTALTLATVNGNVGSFGSATQAGTFTVNGKGLVTAASNTTIAIPESAVTNLVSDLAAKQATLVSATNIKTINGSSVLGSGDLVVSGSAAFSAITGQPTDNANLTTALNLKANLASPAFTGTPTGITATHVGLGNVTNESKATMFASPTFTGTVNGITATMVGLGNVTNESKATMFTSPTFTGTPVGIGIPVYSRVTGSNATTTGQVLANIAGLSNALVANATYEFEAVLSASTTAVTTGTGYGINYSAAGATMEATISGSLTNATDKTLRLNAFNTSSQAWLTTSAQTGGVLIKGTVTVGANAGNLTAQHLKVTSGTSTVFIGSYLKVTRII